MPRIRRTLPLLAKVLLVAGLLCAVVAVRAANWSSTEGPCVMSAASSANPLKTAAMGCHDCCQAAACCLLSKKSADAASHSEPLSNERSRNLDQAPSALACTFIRSLDLFPPPQKIRGLATDRAILPAVWRAPRGAVSCIWLI
jgi:hypothetical protein